MDTSVPGIHFDSEGICNFCKMHDELEVQYPLNETGRMKLDTIIRKIKKDGENRQYDCIIGVSGGTDSSHNVLLAMQLGLRPLLVHFDNGWDTEVSVENINSLVNHYDLDIENYVVDWDEFKNLQIAFLKSSTPEVEIPTDVAILRILYDAAEKHKIKYIIAGHSFRTEGLSPLGWMYSDGRYINDVYQKFTGKKLNKYPNLALWNMINFAFIQRIKLVHLHNYFEYSKETARDELRGELDWKYYGGWHYESLYTKFVITNIMSRFGIDKRKTQLSALVRTRKMSRDEALLVVSEAIPEDPELESLVLNRLGVSKTDYDEWMNDEPKSFKDYNTYYDFIKLMKIPIKIAVDLGFLPKIFYQKYFSSNL